MSISGKFIIAILALLLSAHPGLRAQEYASPVARLQDGKAPGLKVKLLSTVGETQTYILIFTKGDELVAGLTEFSRKHNVKSAHYTGIGDATSIKAGWFNYNRKQFKIIPIDTAEVTSFIGDIAWYKGTRLRIPT